MQKTVKNLPCLISAGFCALILSFVCLSSVSATELEAHVTDNLSTELGIPVYSWAPSKQTDPRAIVLALHGASLHARSFTAISQQLADKGYAVFAADMRGFGAWYKGHNDPDDPSRRILYHPTEKDLQALLARLRHIYPSKSIFLMGESVGANMAVRLLAEDANCADGMILASPAVRQRLFLGPTIVIRFLTVMFKPSSQLSIVPFLRSRVSENPNITNERINDPLARNKMNVGELFKTRFYNKDCMKFVSFVPKHAPVLIIEGTEDKFFESSDVKKLMTNLSSDDKTLHWLKGRGHINLETAYLPPEILEVVSGWLDEKTAKISKQRASEPSVSTVIQGAEHQVH